MVHTLKEAINDPIFPSKRVLVVWIACYVHFFYIFDKLFVPRTRFARSWAMLCFCLRVLVCPWDSLLMVDDGCEGSVGGVAV